MFNFKRPEYADDFFDDTRMSIGDHIEELRFYLVRALAGFVICLFAGFALDAIGSVTGLPIGLGKPMLNIIKAPVEDQVLAFYSQRTWEAYEPLLPKVDPTDADAVKARKAEKERFFETRRQIADGKLGPRELNSLRNLDVQIDLDALRQALKDGKEGFQNIPLKLPPVDMWNQLQEAQLLTGKRGYLTTLSAQEALVVYFKVSMVCGIVLSSPWVFMQIWSFVAAGLYPHERRYVHVFLPFSLGLFLGGVFLCQVFVLPSAVGALLSFNSWLNFDPDLRLSEWLSLALMMPLVFGVSFQTPLVMLFMTRIGAATPETFASQWRIAAMVLAVFAALITPTPDMITMMLLWLPLLGLYILGIYLCKWAATGDKTESSMADEEVAV
jgi:sec-independent protein translocase protein TatC